MNLQILRQVGNLWRTTQDISATWESILSNLDNTVGLAKYAGAGAWNDPDLLEVPLPKTLQGPDQAQHACSTACTPAKPALLKGRDVAPLLCKRASDQRTSLRSCSSCMQLLPCVM